MRGEAPTVLVWPSYGLITTMAVLYGDLVGSDLALYHNEEMDKAEPEMEETKARTTDKRSQGKFNVINKIKVLFLFSKFFLL
jgi:hypothetical protein